MSDRCTIWYCPGIVLAMPAFHFRPNLHKLPLRHRKTNCPTLTADTHHLDRHLGLCHSRAAFLVYCAPSIAPTYADVNSKKPPHPGRASFRLSLPPTPSPRPPPQHYEPNRIGPGGALSTAMITALRRLSGGVPFGGGEVVLLIGHMSSILCSVLQSEPGNRPADHNWADTERIQHFLPNCTTPTTRTAVANQKLQNGRSSRSLRLGETHLLYTA